jgi:glycosyltransferase involved in cell wall biosynthesis
MPEVRLRPDSVCFGVEDHRQAGAYFRGELPAKALRARGWYAETAEYALTPQTDAGLKEYGPYIRGWDGVGKPKRPCKFVTLRIQDDVVMDPATRRLANGYRMDNMAADILRAREAGQVVLYDVDDDLWHIPEWSPAAKAMHKMAPNVRACDLDVVEANMRACNGAIVTTPYLADVVSKKCHVPVYLVRPGIDVSIYLPKPDPLLRVDYPRVGWLGSMSHHLPHLRTMQIALEVLTKFDAEFMRIGYIAGDRSEELLSELPCRVGEMPWVDIDDLPKSLRHIDVGIIPRVPTQFNEGQSVTSGLQYAAAGIPFLVSPSAEYSRLELLGAGKVCRTINDWREGLVDLLDSPEFRQFEADRARECVDRHYGLEATGRRYAKIFGVWRDD